MLLVGPVVKASLTAGDYLFIQFGHNDAKTDEERYTEPYTTYKEYLKKYIDEARAKGAVPVLLTPVHRNGWDGTSIVNSHGDYPDAMRQLAQEEDVPLIDITAKSAALFESYGEEVVTNHFFMNIAANVYSTYPDGNSDNTHLQVRGAYEICKLVKGAFEEQKDNNAMLKLYQSSTDAGLIKTTINEYGLGTVTGSDVVTIGQSATLRAYASSGYVFSAFASGGEVLSKESDYTFTCTDSLLFIDVIFVKGYKVSLGLTPKYKGKVSGSGTFAEGDSVTVVVKPYSGYDFDYWSLNDEVISTDSAYTFLMAAQDITLVANLRVEGSTAVSEKVEDKVKIIYSKADQKLVLESAAQFCSVSLFDMKGNKLKTIDNIQPTTPSVNMSDLPNGLYVVSASLESGSWSDVIMKY